MIDIAGHIAECADWRKVKRVFGELSTLPLATKRKLVYPELVRLTAASLSDPSEVNRAEAYLRVVEGELAHDAELAARLYDAMTGPVAGPFYRFVIAARDPRGIRRLSLADVRAWEEAVVAAGAEERADELVGMLDAGREDLWGVAAALFAGGRARAGLGALYERTSSTWQSLVAIAIALARDPADVAWFKSLSTAGQGGNAKRLHTALTSAKARERIHALDVLGRAVRREQHVFYGTLVGLCLALEDETPEVVERAASALEGYARRGQSRPPFPTTSHHATYLRLARRAIERGVTAKARDALNEIATRIPRSVPLVAHPTIEGASGEVPAKKPRPKRRPAPSHHAQASSADDALLREILAHPDDDAPRLVFADRLVERGDPRGEFIQLQLQLRRSLKGASGYPKDDASRNPPPNHLELAQRETALFRKHAKAWVAPVRSAIRGWYWKRGFLDDIMTGPIFFESHGPEQLLGRHPVTGLRFEGMTQKAFDRFAETAFGSVRKITMYGRQLDSTTARALTGPNLATLTSLMIEYSEIGAEGLAALASSQLRALRHLSISGTFGDAGLAALAKSTAFESLETINLIDPELTDRGLEAFAGAAHFPRLRSVTLQLLTYQSSAPSWSRKGIQMLAERFGDAGTETYYGKRVEI